MKEKLGRLGQVAARGAELLAVVWVARRKAWPAVEKCLLKFSIIMDLSEVTVLPSAVGSWEEVLLFSMDFTDVFVLVKSSQVWSEPRAISVPSSTFFEWGMLV